VADAKLLADFLQESIVRRDGEVSDLNLRRIATSRRSAGGDDWNSTFTAAGDQKAFAGGTVDGIQHEIEFRLQNF